MSFDIPQIHIPDNSPEARAVEYVMSAQHVTAVEAVRSILRGAKPENIRPERNFIKEGRGMFKNPADAKILDEAVALAMEERGRASKQTLA
jgi:hypothetical protein